MVWLSIIFLISDGFKYFDRLEMRALTAELEQTIRFSNIDDNRMSRRKPSSSSGLVISDESSGKYFDFSHHLSALQDALGSHCSELEAAAVISGATNPFVRIKRFPPIHMNINYLIEPAAPLSGITSVVSSLVGTRDKVYQNIIVDRADPV